MHACRFAKIVFASLTCFYRPIARASTNEHEKLPAAFQIRLYRLLKNSRYERPMKRSIDCCSVDALLVQLVLKTVEPGPLPASLVLQHGDGGHGPQHTHTADKTNWAVFA